MCGIVSIHAYRPGAPAPDAGELRRIRDHMAARGPDAAGEWATSDGRLLLGHRRLSIIDLTDRANQPLADADGRFTVTFNGEIYNHRALRAGLEARGRRFRTTSDTEVLLHLYAEKGPAMAEDLRGMFAFAIWDSHERALFFARDPYGIKPLYYADDGQTFRAASQARALLAGGALSREIDPVGEAGFFLFGSLPEPFTFHRAIRALPAGSWMRVDANGVDGPHRFFSIAEVYAQACREPLRATPDQLAAEVAEAVHDSVAHHLVADVPVGCFLSAGVDSGAMAGLAINVGQKAVEAVTLAFDEYAGSAEDETPLAREMAARYGARHTVRRVGREEFLAEIPALLEAMDQPTIDGVNTWFVSKATREVGMKAALSGVGGDELFGGYPSFRDIPLWVRLFALPGAIPGLGGLFRRLHVALGDKAPGRGPKTAGLIELGGSYPGAWLLRRGLFMPWELGAVMGQDRAHEGLAGLNPLAHIEANLTPPPQTPFARVATLETSLYMRNQLLRDIDWASMAHSLEVRTPLVDAWLLKRLAPYLVAAPGLHGKAWLAKAPDPPLPAHLISRPSTGFTAPFGAWLESSPGLGAWRRIPLLNRKDCHWSRRLAYVVHGHFTRHRATGGG